MKNEDKDKIEVYFPKEVKDKIKQIAKEKGTSAAEILRRGAERTIEEYDNKSK